MFLKRKLELSALAALMASTSLFYGCSKSSSSGPSFSGNLSNSRYSLARDFELQAGNASKVSCTTATTPPTTVTGSVSGSGNFSVDLSSVLGDGLTCSVLDSSDEILGTFLYEDSSEKGFGGSSKKIDTVTFNESKDVGTVSIEGGQLTVDADQLGISTSGASVTAAEAFDPTGNWTVGALGFSPPPGFSGPCPDTVPDDQCQSVPEGQNIYIKRVQGKKFTPTNPNTCTPGSCPGTTGSEDAFVISIWMSEDVFNKCGDDTKGAIGFTDPEAKAYGYIDFADEHTVLKQPFNWTTSFVHSATTHTITDGWKDDQAKTSWAIMDCSNVTSGGQTAWKCYDAGRAHYSLGLGGGCKDSNGNPVQPDNWSNVKWESSSGCSQEPVTFAGKTLNRNTCTVPYWPAGNSTNSVNLTCGGAWGAFVNSGGEAPYMGAFEPHELVVQDQFCSSIPEADQGQQLLKLQCYANHFWSSLRNIASNKNVCLRQIRTDWGATTASGFLLNDGPGKPINMALTEKATYLSPDVFTFTQYEDDFRGIEVQGEKGSSWISCRTKVKSTITATKITNTQMVIRIVDETSLADTKDACVAAASNATTAEEKLQLGERRTIFKMTKSTSL